MLLDGPPVSARRRCWSGGGTRPRAPRAARGISWSEHSPGMARSLLEPRIARASRAHVRRSPTRAVTAVGVGRADRRRRLAWCSTPVAPPLDASAGEAAFALLHGLYWLAVRAIGGDDSTCPERARKGAAVAPTATTERRRRRFRYAVARFEFSRRAPL